MANVNDTFQVDGDRWRVTKVENENTVLAKKLNADGKAGRGRPSRFTLTPDGDYVRFKGALPKTLADTSAPLVEVVVHETPAVSEVE